MSRPTFASLIFALFLCLIVPPARADTHPILPANLDSAAVSGEFWRLGFTSEGVSGYNAILGRAASPVAAFQSNRGASDMYYIFPAPAETTTIQAVYFYILERSGSYAAGDALMTLEVFDYAGVSQRVLSAAGIDLQAAAAGAWTPLALAAAGLDLVPGEFLAFHANFSGGAGDNLNVRPVFEVQLGSGAVTRQTVHLPLILKDYAARPDLVVTDLTVSSGSITLTIANQGDGAVTDAFWVDVYFNPTITPSLNQPWDTIAPQGAVWGVTEAGLSQLTPGGVLTLTANDAFYFPDLSSASPWPAGAMVFAQVDSVNFDTTYGAVQESDEGNNVFGPVGSTSAADSPAAGAAGTPSRQGLPERE